MKTLPVLFVALLVSACESDVSRSAYFAEKCKDARQRGALMAAEQLCQSAWTDVDSSRLTPVIRSERLYDLGRIKRLSSKFDEAEPLILEALSIEESVSGRSSPAYGRLLVEMSLALAGQEKWIDGAVFLEPVLQIADRLPEREQLAMVSVLNNYALRLRNAGQVELANRFEFKATELSAVKPGEAGQTE